MNNNYAVYAGLVSDNYRPLIREMMSYGALDPYCNPLHRNQHGSFYPDPPHVLHWSRQVEWPWAVEEAELQLHHDCLEVGGAGTPMKYSVAKRCKSLLSTEIDPLEMPQIQEQIDNQGFTNITQVRANVKDLPFPDNWFDRVFCISVIEHIAEGRVKAIQELARVVKPGGMLLLTMDVALRNAGAGNNFYADESECLSLLKALNIEEIQQPAAGKPLVAFLQKEQTPLSVVLVKYTKPRSGHFSEK